MNKIRLVVYEEHTLGYIEPERPNTLCVIWGSGLRNSPYSFGQVTTISPVYALRTASEKDFNDFNVSFKGYDNREIYLYE